MFEKRRKKKVKYHLLEPMKPELVRTKTLRDNLLEKTSFLKEDIDTEADTESDNNDDEQDNMRNVAFEDVAKNPSTIQKRTYNPPASNVGVAFMSNDEMGKGRSQFYALQGGKGLQAICDLNPEYDLFGYRNGNFK